MQSSSTLTPPDTRAPQWFRPGDPEAAARLHLHIALAGALLSVLAPIVSWTMALLLRRDRAGPWRRRLFALAIVDTALVAALGLAGVDITAEPEPPAAAAPSAEERPALFAPIDEEAAARAQPADRRVLLASTLVDVALVLGLAFVAWRKGASPAPGIATLVGLGAMMVATTVALVLLRAALGLSFGVLLLARLAGSAGLLVAALGLAAVTRGPPHLGGTWGKPLGTRTAVAFGVLYGVAGAVRIGILVALLSAWLHLPMQSASEAFQLDVRWGAPGVLIFALTAMVIAPVGEEVLFRGVLLPWLARWMRPGVALSWSAVVFAAGHLYYGIAAAVLFHYALVLGWARLRTGKLWAPIALHALLNTTTTIVLLARSMR